MENWAGTDLHLAMYIRQTENPVLIFFLCPLSRRGERGICPFPTGLNKCIISAFTLSAATFICLMVDMILEPGIFIIMREICVRLGGPVCRYLVTSLN